MRHFLFLCVLFQGVRGQSGCSVIMPYPGMTYLTPTQLNLYKLTDPCSVMCKPGYFGDSCLLISNVSRVTQGPWNVEGYYTSAVGAVKNMALSLSNQYTGVSFTGSDSTLVGLYNSQLFFSGLKLISLSSQTTINMLSMPFLDAVQVRYGQIFVARSTNTNNPELGPFEISVVKGPPYTLVPYMNISLRAANIEIFQDKGTHTAFVFSISSKSEYQLRACYPNNTCNLWYTANSPISSMACGMDCPHAVYIALQKSIHRVSSAGATVVITSPFLINCMASSPALNTLLYRTGATVQQLSLGANGTSASGRYYPNVMTIGVYTGVCTGTCCSLDISDSGALIMLVEDGLIQMVESIQMPCPNWQTSKSFVSTSVSDCVACPAAPTNGYLIPGSSTCSWRCSNGFTKLGSQCVSLPTQPCPRYFYSAGWACLPSGMPWAPGGYYRVKVNSSQVGYIKPPSINYFGYVFGAGTAVIPPYVVSMGPTVSFASMTMNLYGAMANSNAWLVMTVRLPYIAQEQCGNNINNDFYYLMQQGGVLWVGFFMRTGNEGKYEKHCLWGLDVSKSAQNITTPVNVSGSWSVGGYICSATGDGAGNAYVIQCGTNFVSKAPFGGGGLTVVAGQSVKGYLDGPVLLGLFNLPSSVVYYNQRLFVADTGNCVLREVDLVRGGLATVAGMIGVCERLDDRIGGTVAGLVYPTNLTLTVYPGVFLFSDKGTLETTPTIRQYNADSGSVLTIQASVIPGVTSLAGFGDRVHVHAQSTGAYYEAVALSAKCPEGSISQQGGAQSIEECLACFGGFYSNGSVCLACSAPVCPGVGQRVLPCGAASDAKCGACANKPNGSIYTGPAEAYDGYVECPWAYIPPCPVGYYQNGTQACVVCPDWSTTAKSNSTSLNQCQCRNGMMVNGGCVIPSPYNTSLPEACPVLTSCASVSVPTFPFPLTPSCTSPGLDTYLGVCVCLPGQYIAQVFPKVCLPCPSHLYSPDGTTCIRCPPYAVPTMDGTACRCVSGTVDVSVSSKNLLCVCGTGSGFSTNGCVKCQANTYGPGTVTLSSTPWFQYKFCVQCLPGTFSGVGEETCQQCQSGQYREARMSSCMDCNKGQYATDPARADSCTDCLESCGGRLQTPCPTDGKLYVCADCPPIRANAYYSGGDNCATVCMKGFYERYETNGDCAPCTAFNATTCPAGNYVRDCGSYFDSECLPCVNGTKPEYYSKWYAEFGAPGLSCSWECIKGYTARQLAPGLWECAGVEEWSAWDLFTV